MPFFDKYRDALVMYVSECVRSKMTNTNVMSYSRRGTCLAFFKLLMRQRQNLKKKITL